MSTLNIHCFPGRLRARENPADVAPEELHRGCDFAVWLIAARGLKGWNKIQLAHASGVSPTYVGVLENNGINNTTGGYQRPSARIIHKLATATGANEDAGRAAAGYAPKLHQEPGQHPEIVLRPGEVFVIRDYVGGPGQQVYVTPALAAIVRELADAQRARKA